MTELDPCPSCRRHVAVVEAACPFCGLVLAARTAQPLAANRLARAAIFVAGAALAGCWTNKPAPKDTAVKTSPPDAGVALQRADASTKPPHDDDENLKGLGPNQRRYQHHPCTSPGNGQPPVCAPYGAPPARRRIV